VFVDADADGSGRLDFEEFKDVVMKIDPEISSTRISHMFRQLVSRETFSPLPIPAANAMCLYVVARGCASSRDRWMRVFVCMNLPSNLSVGPRKQS